MGPDSITPKVQAGILAGATAGVVTAALDIFMTIRDTGSYWVDVSSIGRAVAVYVLSSASLGALLGFLSAALRNGPIGDPPKSFARLAALFVFAAVLFLCVVHIFDETAVSKRDEILTYWAAPVVAMLAATSSFICLRGFLHVFRGRAHARALSALTLTVVLFAGTSLSRNVVGKAPSAADREDSGFDTEPADLRPNILVFVMDTLRADSLSCYGNPRTTTPNLDRLAAEGVLFTRAYAPASWTPPSHASLLTGLYPSHHGTASNQVELGPGPPTIAEHLSSAGYRTLFVASKALLRDSAGWGRGFDHFLSVHIDSKVSPVYERLAKKLLGVGPSDTRLILDLAQRWLDSGDTAPAFLVVNVNNVHTPYVERNPFARECVSGLDLTNVDTDRVQRVVANQQGLRAHNEGNEPLNPTELAYVRCLYESEVVHLDQEIGDFFHGLERASRPRDLVAVVTSDHGELLGEHGLLSHGSHLFDELIRVPLIVWGAGTGTGTDDRLASLIDVLPTALDIAGIAGHSERAESAKDSAVAGHSILREPEPRELFAEAWAGSVAKKVVLTANYKYEWQSDRKESLSSLTSDPGESPELSQTRAEVIHQLRSKLSANFDLSMIGTRPEDLDEALLEQLRSLGYVQ